MSTTGEQPRAQRVLRFGERMEQTEQTERLQSYPHPSSNGYQGTQEGSEAEVDASANSRASREVDTRNGSQGIFADPPNPPTLGAQQRREPFGVCHTHVGRREIIKLSIEFPLKSGNSGNDIALFFKRFITVLFTANRKILLTKWILGDENPISKAIDIAYDEDTIGEYYAGMKLYTTKVAWWDSPAFYLAINFREPRVTEIFELGYRRIKCG